MMMGVGVLFVINSLDSLTRLYAQNLGWTAERLGFKTYMLAHMTLLLGLVALYQFTSLKIEWIGMIVIALYAVVYVLILRHRALLSV
jgi:hypothetical protein